MKDAHKACDLYDIKTRVFEFVISLDRLVSPFVFHRIKVLRKLIKIGWLGQR